VVFDLRATPIVSGVCERNQRHQHFSFTNRSSARRAGPIEVGAKIVRILLLVCCALLTLIVSSGGQSGEADPYSLNIVKFELQMRAGGRKVIHSFSQKSLFRLGDGVSIAILKILDDSALTNPETVRDLLPIVRDAFAAPQFISIAANKTPKVTLFLLNYLRLKVSDPETQLAVQETAEFVEHQTRA
jgi:hypothetical protein